MLHRLDNCAHLRKGTLHKRESYRFAMALILDSNRHETPRRVGNTCTYGRSLYPLCHNPLVDMELRENLACHSISRGLVIRT